MAEYIDRDKILDCLAKDYLERTDNEEALICNVWDKIKKIPTADVVEVVRCKDCNNSAEVACDVMYCCYFNKNVEEDDYCSNGC